MDCDFLGLGTLFQWIHEKRNKDSLKIVSTVLRRPRTLVEQSACYHKHMNRADIKGYEVSIRLVQEDPFLFYNIYQWQPFHDNFYERKLGSIQLFEETGKIWVRWRYQSESIREFTNQELYTLLDLFENATESFKSDLLIGFHQMTHRSECYTQKANKEHITCD